MENIHARTIDVMTAGLDHWISVRNKVQGADVLYESYLPEDCRCNARSKIRGLHQPLNQNETKFQMEYKKKVYENARLA